MHKTAVLAICLLFASTVLQGATKHSKKSSASKHSISKSSPAKSGAKKAASKGSGKTRSAKSGTARKTSRSKTRASARRRTEGEDEGEVRQTATRKGKGRGRTRRASGTKAARSARRDYQRTPTPDRYREIQQALADRGFYQGPVNGEWGGESADALKRFQQQQNLTPTGKLDSLSLISLGLGPKREPKAAPVSTSTNSSSTTTSQKEPLQP